MGNYCCDEQKTPFDERLPSEKIRITDNQKTIEHSTILKSDDFQPRRYLGKGIHYLIQDLLVR